MELVEGQDFVEYVRGRAPRLLHAQGHETLLHEPDAKTGDLAVAPTIRHLRTAAPALDEEKLRGALRQLAEAIGAIHAAGLVHRDVKPSNIRVTAGGRLVLLDFGLVTEMGDEHRTTAHDIVGTPAYMAPEQATRSDVGPEADWYGVGVLLYEALVGALPFSGTPIEMLLKKQGTHPAPASEIDPNVPSDLGRLCSDLLRFDPAARPTGADILRVLGASEVRVRSESLTRSLTQRTLDAPFVGRATEIHLLQQALRDSRAGAPVSVVVSGESGVGKTTLVRQFVDAARALDPGVVVLMDRCYERESVPYKALDGVVDALARFLARLPDAEATSLLPTRVGPLAQVFPVLQRVDSIVRMSRGFGGAADPSELRVRAFAAMRELLVRFADRTPLIIVIDDAQWADADSRLLLDEVLRPPEAPSLLLVATIRAASDESGVIPPPEGLTATLPGDVRRMELGSLPYEDGRALAALLLDRSGAAHRADARRIAEESRGHPLFIDTLVRSETRAAVMGGRAQHLEDVLWDMIERLDSLAGLTMRLLAVAGTPLPQEALAKAVASEPDSADLPRRLLLLRAAHLVQTTGARKRDAVACYHDRIRATVLAHISKDERAPLHRRLALALESTIDGAENVALHWLGAGEPGRAVEQTIRAADGAASALAFEHAALLYKRALDLNVLQREAADAVRVKLAESFAKAGRGVEAAAVYLELAGNGASNRAIDLRRRAGEQLVCSGHLQEGLRTFDAALDAVGFRRPQTNLAVLVSLFFWNAWLALRGLRFVPRSEDELDPRALLRVDCLASAGPGLGMTDHFRGTAFQMRALSEALRLGEPARVGRALAFYAFGLASAGQPAFARVMGLQRRVERMARELGRPYLAGLACGVTGFAHYLSGRFPEARQAFERTEAILRDQCVGVSYELSTARIMHFRTLLALGEIQAVVGPVATCLSDAERKGDSYTILSLRTNVTPFLALARDDVPGAPVDAAPRSDPQSPLSRRPGRSAHRVGWGEDARCGTGPSCARAGASRVCHRSSASLARRRFSARRRPRRGSQSPRRGGGGVYEREHAFGRGRFAAPARATPRRRRGPPTRRGERSTHGEWANKKPGAHVRSLLARPGWLTPVVATRRRLSWS